MAWNESRDGKTQEIRPWNGHKQSSPPDLDEAFKNLQNKIRKALGGDKSSGTGGPGSPGAEEDVSLLQLFGLVFSVIFVFWVLSGIFILGPAEKAVILRFGQYSRTVGPGPHWIPRFVDSKIVRNVDRRSKFSYSADMLTKDENLVSVSLNIQYRIYNLKDFLFNVTKPDESLKQATASALRQVVGHTTFDSIITEGREKWGQDVEVLLQDIMKPYNTGIQIVEVSPQPAKAPESVQDAFDDAIKAREDGKRFQEQARAYKARLIPIAQGKAKRILEQAAGYRQQVVLKAKGDVAEFSALLPQYRLAPEVLRERMYLDSIEQVLSQSSKIVIDGRAGNMFYLPLDKLLKRGASQGEAVPDKEQIAAMTALKNKDKQLYKSLRRGGRLSHSGDFRDGRNY